MIGVSSTPSFQGSGGGGAGCVSVTEWAHDPCCVSTSTIYCCVVLLSDEGICAAGELCGTAIGSMDGLSSPPIAHS